MSITFCRFCNDPMDNWYGRKRTVCIKVDCQRTYARLRKESSRLYGVDYARGVAKRQAARARVSVTPATRQTSQKLTSGDDDQGDELPGQLLAPWVRR